MTDATSVESILDDIKMLLEAILLELQLANARPR